MMILIAAFIVVLILASFTMSGIFIEGSSPETRAQSLKTTESIARIGGAILLIMLIIISAGVTI